MFAKEHLNLLIILERCHLHAFTLMQSVKPTLQFVRSDKLLYSSGQSVDSLQIASHHYKMGTKRKMVR